MSERDLSCEQLHITTLSCVSDPFYDFVGSIHSPNRSLFLFCLFLCGRYSVIIQPGDGSQQNSPTKGDTSTSRVDSGESNDEKIVLYLG